MGWADVFSSLANLLNEWRTDRTITNDFTAVYTDMQGIALTLVRFIMAILWWIAHLSAGVNDATQSMRQAGGQIAKVEANNLAAWSDFLNTKYPADLRALYRAVTSAGSASQQEQKKQQDASLAELRKEIAELETWKQETVTPDLKQWNGFLTKWKSTYQPPALTLIQWLASPDKFATWALPPLISNAASALASKPSQMSATAIELVLVRTWTNDAGPIWQAIQQWLVTEQ